MLKHVQLEIHIKGMIFLILSLSHYTVYIVFGSVNKNRMRIITKTAKKEICLLCLLSTLLTNLSFYIVRKKQLFLFNYSSQKDMYTNISLLKPLYFNYSNLGRSTLDLKLLLAPPRDTLKYQRPTPLPGYKNPCFELDFDDIVAYGKSQKDTVAMFSKETVQDRPGVRKCVVCFPSVYLMGVAKCGSTEITRYIQAHHSVYSGRFQRLLWVNVVTLILVLLYKVI